MNSGTPKSPQNFALLSLCKAAVFTMILTQAYWGETVPRKQLIVGYWDQNHLKAKKCRALDGFLSLRFKETENPKFEKWVGGELVVFADLSVPQQLLQLRYEN